MIKLGDLVTDSITGFSGIATAKTLYLYGCARVRVQPSDLIDGKIQDSFTFDELQLVENDDNHNIFPEIMGKIVTDSISNISGKVIAYTTYVHASPRLCLQKLGYNKEGKPYEPFDVDAPQVVEYVEPKVEEKRTGGPGDVVRRCGTLSR